MNYNLPNILFCILDIDERTKNKQIYCGLLVYLLVKGLL